MHLIQGLTNSILLVLLLKSIYERSSFAIILTQIANFIAYNVIFVYFDF